MQTTSTPGSSASTTPDKLIQNPLDRTEPGRDQPRTDQPHDPGPGLLTNPLDKPGAKDNLIKNPLDRA